MEKFQCIQPQNSIHTDGSCCYVMGTYHVGGEMLSWKFLRDIQGALNDEIVQNETL